MTSHQRHVTSKCECEGKGVAFVSEVQTGGTSAVGARAFLPAMAFTHVLRTFRRCRRETSSRTCQAGLEETVYCVFYMRYVVLFRSCLQLCDLMIGSCRSKSYD